jgi:transglutaminase-like putative cysteine protease
MEDESIRLADDLLAEALVAKRNNAVADKKDSVILSEKEKIDKLYSYVVENIIYDYDKIDGLEYSYVPHNDVTLELKAGICYDYSSLLASMLRSQGIPTKMVKGYANTSSVYHAWNEVFLSDEKRWVVVDTTFDAYREQNGYSYSFEKVSSNYNKVKEF